MFDFFKKNKKTEEEIIQIILGADKQDPQALAELHGLYKDSKMTDSKKHSLRKKGYFPLAEAGDVDAQLWMGLLSVADDDGQEAERWFLLAADQGNTQAMLQLSLGYSIFNACSFGEDSEKSLYWIKKAADCGNPDAQCQLATEYASGETMEQDYECSYQWYQKAAEQNYPEAFLGLADIYTTEAAWNTHYDREKSRDYLVKAMETRDKGVCARASSLLALHYAGDILEGESTTISAEDANSAIYWLCQSFWFGNRGAIHQLVKLRDITGFDISEEQSSQWRYDYRSPDDEDE